MQKKTPDYDNVFKTMKSRHKRLFISVINDIFGKDYPMDARVDVLPSEGYLTESGTADGSSEIEEQISDFHGNQDCRVCFYRCEAVCNMGYRSCGNSNAKVLSNLCQEDG